MKPIHSQTWVEIDLRQFQKNLDLIWRDKPRPLSVGIVLKDDAYGHGAARLAPICEKQGASCLIVASLQEGYELRRAGTQLPILVLGERHSSEFETCLEFNLTPTFGEPEHILSFAKWLASRDRSFGFHLKVNTGMNRYGLHFSETSNLVGQLKTNSALRLDGIMSHFSMSDETDKSYALEQLSRFREALQAAENLGMTPRCAHICNSGGFLDLPQAHFQMVRLGILPLGVFPSAVCRRIEGIKPIMSVKVRVAAIRELRPGDKVGYGMRFTAPGPMRIAVLPIGYGAGFPRVRNEGFALLHGKRAPVVGGVSMDAITVDVTQIPEVRTWDVATIMGRDGSEEITAQDLATLKKSVSYDILVSWQTRLPRHYIEGPGEVR